MSLMLKTIDNLDHRLKSSACVGIDVTILMITYFWRRNTTWRYNHARTSRRRDIGKAKASQFTYVMPDEDFPYLA